MKTFFKKYFINTPISGLLSFVLSLIIICIDGGAISWFGPEWNWIDYTYFCMMVFGVLQILVFAIPRTRIW